MDYSRRTQRTASRCLECGDKIGYGRSDKKFCCDECKNRHHNHKARSSRFVKRKVISILEKNHEILNGLVRNGVEMVCLSEIMILGFNPGYATAFRKVSHHEKYECFDITYSMTAGRLTSISKIQNLSLNLQARSNRVEGV